MRSLDGAAFRVRVRPQAASLIIGLVALIIRLLVVLRVPVGSADMDGWVATTQYVAANGFSNVYSASLRGNLYPPGFFVPLWLQIAVPSRVEKLPANVTYTAAADGTKTWSGLSWEALGQNPTMQAQWEKLGYKVEGAADIITQPFDYTIDYAGIVITALVILGYFVFMLRVSEKEYRQVIAEKFD